MLEISDLHEFRGCDPKSTSVRGHLERRSSKAREASSKSHHVDALIEIEELRESDSSFCEDEDDVSEFNEMDSNANERESSSSDSSGSDAEEFHKSKRARSTKPRQEKSKKQRHSSRLSSQLTCITCITEDAVIDRLAEADEAAHIKKMEKQAKKDKSNAKKLEKAEQRIKASQLKLDQAKKKYEDERRAVLKSQKASNNNQLICYICEESMPSPTAKKSWLSCEDCGYWCCEECRPAMFKDANCTPKTFYCNDCSLKN